MLTLQYEYCIDV